MTNKVFEHTLDSGSVITYFEDGTIVYKDNDRDDSGKGVLNYYSVVQLEQLILKDSRSGGK